ncbi:MAG: hypothetical protein CVV49_15555 [Spirochaetae bacterium HGW-Spirochaetae-5]|nr:MAG: hypothetical protein CVV49_15555 [Spirochaetae bacterium HGW-Spirochaetae-5]
MKNRDDEMMKIVYLSKKMKDADNRKYLLIKNLYEMSNLTYGKSSRESDYIILDRLGEFIDEVDRYIKHIRLFDNGKNGDIKAYEDILVFFQNSFCDSFILEDKITKLNNAIKSYKSEEKEHKQKTTLFQIESSNSSNIIDLELKIKKYELMLNHELIHGIREFLDNINYILFCENLLFLIGNYNIEERSRYNENKIVEMEKYIGTFLWINNKIYNKKLSEIKLKSLINDTIHQAGLEESLLSVTGLTKEVMGNTIGNIAADFTVLSGELTKENIDLNGIVTDNNTVFYSNFELSLNLKTLIDHLVSINKNNDTDLLLDEYKMTTGLGHKKSGRYIFYISGSYKTTLKSISDYLCNSLIFVYFWFRKELKSGSFSFEPSVILTECITYSYDFLKYYKAALLIADNSSNQRVSVLGRELQQFIPEDLAKLLVKAISDNCDVINESVLELTLRIAGSPLKKDLILLKKLSIINNSFKDACYKIMNEISKLGL